jgi:hypothetical protein
MARSNRVWVVGVCCAVGCGQDLALPEGYGQPSTSGGAGPAEGVTGVGGAGGAGSASVSAPPTPSSVGKGGASPAKGGASGTGGAATGGDGGSPSPPEPAEAGNGGTAAGSGGEGGQAAVQPPQLLLSEYVEGSKSNKALELFALRGGSLEGCELQTFANGKTEPSKLALHGEVAAGELYVLCSSELGSAQLAPCSRSTNLSFNGDDALSIVCQGVVQDIFGEIGVDPGESWGMGATVDHTLQRRCEVTAGRVDAAAPFELDAEWVTFGVDTFSDLGKRLCD